MKSNVWGHLKYNLSYTISILFHVELVKTKHLAFILACDAH